ncbi:hypothetical protein ES319_D07G094400v1 [Gossypium barbadense]|uniref:DNA mismatch repair proteins mutS family domain-containing protein n=3 Tax=Gossypium TaxID=3633 RepID=A0A5J5QQF6_GOSBA|nr:hypothetical protein ES319_D07G094400v1 [Gossypium barbadense]
MINQLVCCTRIMIQVQCRGMFSTHYHRLAVDYRNNSKGFLTQYYEQLPVSLENLRLYTGNTEARDLKTSCQCKVVLTKW